MAAGLDELIVELLADVGVDAPANREYARGGVVFAAWPADDVIELRLGDEIAEAARRTPSTSESARGPGWVRLAPAEWDAHAVDRLRAWFLTAWRMAGRDA